jgi:hypothetical protein
MLPSSVRNIFRLRMVNVAREYKTLFFGDNGKMKQSGEHVLADLRSFCKADQPTIFNKEPMLMARREGRREVFVRIQRMLNLDESQVQKLMEIDHDY